MKGVRKSKLVKEIEAKWGKSIAQVLSELYAKYQNLDEVGKELGIDGSTVSVWMRYYGVYLQRVAITESSD